MNDSKEINRNYLKFLSNLAGHFKAVRAVVKDNKNQKFKNTISLISTEQESR